VSWNDLTMDADVISAGAVLFRNGDRLSLSPEYIAGVSAEYGFPLGRGNKQVRIWTGANYTSESAAHAIVAGQGVVFESDALLVGRAGISLDNDHWIASFFIDNVTDEDGVVQGAANLPRSFDTRLRPRTTGVQFEYRYGAR
jgi:hypothetical protein